jgi:hypothetical protein
MKTVLIYVDTNMGRAAGLGWALIAHAQKEHGPAGAVPGHGPARFGYT